MPATPPLKAPMNALKGLPFVFAHEVSVAAIVLHSLYPIGIGSGEVSDVD